MSSRSLEGVRVYDASTGELLRRLPGTRLMPAVELSPDGSLPGHRRLGAGRGAGEATVRIWDTRDLAPGEDDAGPARGIQLTSLAFSPDGSELAIGGADGAAGVWSVKTGEQTPGVPRPDVGDQRDRVPAGRRRGGHGRERRHRVGCGAPRGAKQAIVDIGEPAAARPARRRLTSLSSRLQRPAEGAGAEALAHHRTASSSTRAGSSGRAR